MCLVNLVLVHVALDVKTYILLFYKINHGCIYSHDLDDMKQSIFIKSSIMFPDDASLRTSWIHRALGSDVVGVDL